MKNGLLTLMVVAALALTIGCDNIVEEEPLDRLVQANELELANIASEDDLLASFIQADEQGLAKIMEAHPRRGSTAPVYTFDNPDGPPVGQSWLLRTPNGIAYQLQTTLKPGTAATIWLIFFNAPENCTPAVENGPPACGEDDLFNPDALVDVVWGLDGAVASSGVSFSGYREKGDNSFSLWEALGIPSPGLIDTYTTEIHIILRDHGQFIPGMEMTSTFNGGCELGDFPEDPIVGPPGPNTCEDTHFSVHQPAAQKTNFHFVSVSTGPAGAFLMAGDGVISPGRVVGGGSFQHQLAGGIISEGVWKARRLVSFSPIGTFGIGVAGVLNMEVFLIPASGPAMLATLEVVCNIPPAELFTGKAEGYTLTAPFGDFVPLGPPPVGITWFTNADEPED